MVPHIYLQFVANLIYDTNTDIEESIISKQKKQTTL